MSNPDGRCGWCDRRSLLDPCSRCRAKMRRDDTEKSIKRAAAKLADLNAAGHHTFVKCANDTVRYIPRVWVVLAECCGHDIEWILEQMDKKPQTKWGDARRGLG